MNKKNKKQQRLWARAADNFEILALSNYFYVIN